MAVRATSVLLILNTSAMIKVLGCGRCAQNFSNGSGEQKHLSCTYHGNTVSMCEACP